MISLPFRLINKLAVCFLDSFDLSSLSRASHTSTSHFHLFLLSLLFSALLQPLSIPTLLQEHFITLSFRWPLFSLPVSSLLALSSISTAHFPCYPHPPLPHYRLPFCSLNMDKFCPVFSLTKRPSVCDTGRSGNHRSPATLSHLSMSGSNIHTSSNNLHELSKKHQRTLSVCECMLACKHVFLSVFQVCVPVHGCMWFVWTCQQQVCISALLHAYVQPAVQAVSLWVLARVKERLIVALSLSLSPGTV